MIPVEVASVVFMLPEPIHSIVSSTEVISAIVLVVVTVLTWIVAKLKASIKQIDASVQLTRTEATLAANHAAIAQDSVTNNHDKNLRDDMDEFRDAVFARLDKMEADARAAELARERRDRRSEDQIDGLRDDVRDLTNRADRDHQVIHSRIDSLKNDLHLPHD